MALFENFPYTNLHELNLDWLINVLNDIKEGQVFSVNGQTGEVILYQDANMVLPAVSEGAWSIVRMADGTSRGILFQDNDKAYIVHGDQMGEIYTAGNQPPYPVTRVNGQYGDITLYTEQFIQLPTLSDENMHSWNIFRTLNNVSRGIQFDDTGSAYIIAGNQRYKIYTDNDVPASAVTSVNGQSGNVVLYTDTDGEMTLPAVIATGATGWILQRSVNGVNTGIRLNNDGSVSLVVNNTSYDIYTENNPPANWVDDPEAPVIEISSPLDYGTRWGFIRETTEGPVGIVVDNSSQLTEPQAFIQYVDSNDQTHTIKLLTPADIPSGSGVVSVNGLSGVVTITGSNIHVSNTDSTPIDEVIEDIQESNTDLAKSIAFYEPGTIATHNIDSGRYVVWNNSAYIASENIAIGDTLSSTNLTLLDDGITNWIQDYIDTALKPLAEHISFLKSPTSVIRHMFNVPSGSSHYIYFKGSTTARMWYGVVSCSTSGVVSIKQDYSGSNTTPHTGTNSIYFDLDAASYGNLFDISFRANDFMTYVN